MEVMIASAPALARLVGEADHRQAGCVTAGAIDQARQATLTAAYHAHPERFGRRATATGHARPVLDQRTARSTHNKLIELSHLT